MRAPVDRRWYNLAMMRWTLWGLFLLPWVGGCTREVWVTPVAVLPPHVSTCPVEFDLQPGADTKVLATLRCRSGAFNVGKPCIDLLRENVCAVGGDVAFGAHWEGDDLVITAGKSAHDIGTANFQRSDGTSKLAAPPSDGPPPVDITWPAGVVAPPVRQTPPGLPLLPPADDK
jgi:hypothetical protein